ncbi:MAG TPA: DUF4440 domain-containing protein [Candidatus Paceibacterota bacterium]
MKPNLELFLDLETKLHKKEIRNSRAAVSDLLADDFIEFGSSGKIYDKNITLESLEQEDSDLEIEVSDFKAQSLSPDTVQVTYATSKLDTETGTKFRSLRSSIWKLNDGKWQMLFHQGTKMA